MKSFSELCLNVPISIYVYIYFLQYLWNATKKNSVAICMCSMYPELLCPLVAIMSV